MGRWSLLALLAIWFLTTGSSCSGSVNSGRTTVVATDWAAGATVALYLVGISIYCIANTEECFPDEEALQAQADAFERARATYTAGLRRHREGDPVGLEWICLSAHQGYARAQYYYGSYLYRQGPAHRKESVQWLWQAAAQGHPEADLMLRQVAGLTARVPPRTASAEKKVPPPSVLVCAKDESTPTQASL